MKRLFLSSMAILLGFTVLASQKVDRMEENKWNWTEYSSSMGNVTFEDGFMVLKSNSLPKGNPFNQVDYIKAVEASTVKTYAKLPIRPNDNYKVTIKYIDPNFGKGFYNIYFNVPKGCIEDNQCGSYVFQVGLKGQYMLPSFDGQIHMDKLPIKGKKDFPMTFVLTKKGKNATIEVNGIELYNGICPLTEPCIGFGVLWKKTIKIDEIIVEQADYEDE